MHRPALLALLALFACARDRGPHWREAAGEPRAGGTLRAAAKDAVSTLDPATAIDEPSLYVLHALVDGLVGYAADGTALEPRLAESWDIASDGKRYRFRLRPDLAYADGRPIVAADLARGLERVLRKPDSPFAAQLAGLTGAQAVIDGRAPACTGIVVHGDRELELRLDAPNAALLYVLAMPFASPLAPGDAGRDLRHGPTASGPYELVEWDEGRRLELRRRARYHEPSRQRLDRIVQLENVPRDVQFLMFERDELDLAEPLAAPDLVWVVQQPAWRPYVRSRAVMNAYGSRMNTTKPPFSDRRVRQALNYAVDKDHIVKLLGGTAVPSHGVLAPGAFGRDDTLAPYPHDPARARELLREAGYPAGFTVSYMTFADEDAEKLAASLQADLAEVGVRVDLSVVAFSTWAEAQGNPEGPAFSIATWTGDYPDPTSLLDPLFHSRSDRTTNSTRYANPVLDELLDAARAERDPRERAGMYHRAERILYDDAPWIFGYHQVMTEVAQPYVRSPGPHPIWIRDYPAVALDLGPDGRPVPR